jgi:molybdate transport system substrate-binding protein
VGGRVLSIAGGAAVLAALVAGVAAGCGDAAAQDVGGSGAGNELTVFAAASLTSAFTDLGKDYSAAHPGVTVRFDFAGSSDLVAQIRQGAGADVVATADTATMDELAGSVTSPRAFAGNRLAVAVAPGNPRRITSLADLADPDLKVVLAAPEVPAGEYASEVLAAQGVTVDPVSLEDSVKGVVTKVAMGEADAGIVYATDITAAGGDVDGVKIPRPQNVIAIYPIAVLTSSKDVSDAQGFVDFVLSPAGQKVMNQYGFLPPTATK